MANAYFQFKQFRIEQGGCAQKVSTDACLLGATANLAGATRVLDLGTGTGLLALMVAQRAPEATIEAIELDLAAATQAAANVAASAWASRVHVHPLSLAAYVATQPAQFSHIICNPPFFQQSLRPPSAARAAARHAGASSLTFEEIVAFAAGFLLPQGQLAVLLPPPEMVAFERVAGLAGLATRTRLAVRHRAGGRLTRCIWEFGLEAAGPVAEQELLIEGPAGEGYAAAFRELLAPFYLHL